MAPASACGVRKKTKRKPRDELVGQQWHQRSVIVLGTTHEEEHYQPEVDVAHYPKKTVRLPSDERMNRPTDQPTITMKHHPAIAKPCAPLPGRTCDGTGRSLVLGISERSSRGMLLVRRRGLSRSQRLFLSPFSFQNLLPLPTHKASWRAPDRKVSGEHSRRTREQWSPSGTMRAMK